MTWVDLRSAYQTLLQSNDKEITDPSNLKFSGVFDSYVNTFISYTNKDLCSIYYKSAGSTIF